LITYSLATTSEKGDCWWSICVSNFIWTCKWTSPLSLPRNPSSLKCEPKVSNLWNNV
jgi:hypothetical protein